VAVVSDVEFGGLQGHVGEVGVPVDPLMFVELEAAFSDGEEVVCQ
jgi:hypothetical protein